ncbi:MAG: hypothetical protein ACI3ZY_01665 [Parabacteroides sp.]
MDSGWLCREIFHTHDDAVVGHVLEVGFDERRDLVVDRSELSSILIFHLLSL